MLGIKDLQTYAEIIMALYAQLDEKRVQLGLSNEREDREKFRVMIKDNHQIFS